MPDNSNSRTVPSPDKKPDPKYVVGPSPVGPFPEGSVFSRSEFAKLYPLPDNPATRDSGLVAAGEDQYHEDLLNRLVANGVIGPTSDDAKTTPLEPGPENRSGTGKATPSAAHVQSDDAAQKDAAANTASQRVADAKDRKADAKNEGKTENK